MSGGRIRKSLVGISSSFPATRLSAPTWLESQRQSGLTNTGGVTAASASRATAFSSNAGPGSPRSETYGGASGRDVSGNTRERQPSDYSLGTRERLRPFCSFCGILRSDGWLLWHLGGDDEEWEGLRRSSYGLRKTIARGFVAARAGKGRPRLYFSFCVFSYISVFFGLFSLAAFGWKETRTPHWDGVVACGLLQVRPVGDGKVGRGSVYNHRRLLLGSGGTAAMALRVACCGLQITDFFLKKNIEKLSRHPAKITAINIPSPTK